MTEWNPPVGVRGKAKAYILSLILTIPPKHSTWSPAMFRARRRRRREKKAFPINSECQVATSCIWTLQIINVYVQPNLRNQPGNYTPKKTKHLLTQCASCKTGCSQPQPGPGGLERKMSARHIFIQHLSPNRQNRGGVGGSLGVGVLGKHSKSS